MYRYLTHFRISTFLRTHLSYRKNWRTRYSLHASLNHEAVFCTHFRFLCTHFRCFGFSTVLTSRKFDARLSLFNFRCLMYSLQIHKQANRTHYSSRGIKMYSLHGHLRPALINFKHGIFRPFALAGTASLAAAPGGAAAAAAL